jgi:hypothetical protein
MFTMQDNRKEDLGRNLNKPEKILFRILHEYTEWRRK